MARGGAMGYIAYSCAPMRSGGWVRPAFAAGLRVQGGRRIHVLKYRGGWGYGYTFGDGGCIFSL